MFAGNYISRVDDFLYRKHYKPMLDHYHHTYYIQFNNTIYNSKWLHSIGI